MKRSVDQALFAALNEVVDPVLFHSLRTLGTLRETKLRRGVAEVHIGVPGPDYPAESELRRRLLAASGEEVSEIVLNLVDLTEDERSALGAKLAESTPMTAPSAAGRDHGPTTERPNPFADRSSATRVLAISSGKGGVGKSSITVNLAVALAQAGHSVGILDADIYGFSVPGMLGVRYLPIVLGTTIIPPVAQGVRCISIGFFVDEEQAIAWRGPMLHRAIEQFLVDVHWGAPEFLLIDMPPGTGDIALSVVQQLPRSEIYVVTTPQDSAERVAKRMGSLAKQMKIPVRGVIENMSYLETPDGSRLTPFGEGGGQRLANALGTELLATIPLVEQLRIGSDEGAPIVASDPEGATALIFAALAHRIAGLAPTRIFRKELTLS